MNGILKRYKALDYQLPKTYFSWDLFGAGLDNLGRGGKPVEHPLREPNSDEVLLRVDALGLCFSDTKLIWAGSEHPRIRGRDLKNDPTVAGHEAALTVVKVGANWKNKFNPGQRFIIQADITIGGEQKAFGYVQRGAMAQFTYVGPWVLDGEGTCYLLPMKDSTGYAEAALVEPWACVEAAYHIPERGAPRAGGRVLAVFVGDAKADFSGVFAKAPAKAVALGAAGRDLSALGTVVDGGGATPEAVATAAKDGGFDDIFLVGNADAKLIEACDAALGQNGILCFLADKSAPKAMLDIGRVHYHLTRYVGSRTGKAKDAYGANMRKDLAPGGRTWMVGAAGPMGQMHVQRALELANPPAKIFCTDLSQERLDYMVKRLQPLADRKNVDMVCLNVKNATNLDETLRIFSNQKGFDDIYVHAPVAALAEHAAGFLGDKSVFNIFAGVGLGTKSGISADIFMDRHTRLIGSSGSSMDDIKNTLAKMERGELATRMSLAALGGIEATWLGIKGVKENSFPGKTVIFPALHGLDLMAVEKLASICPSAAAKLENGGVWTSAAEDEMLEKLLKL